MVAFAKDVDVLTVEIEHINADAMQQVCYCRFKAREVPTRV